MVKLKWFTVLSLELQSFYLFGVRRYFKGFVVLMFLKHCAIVVQYCDTKHDSQRVLGHCVFVEHNQLQWKEVNLNLVFLVQVVLNYFLLMIRFAFVIHENITYVIFYSPFTLVSFLQKLPTQPLHNPACTLSDPYQ